MGRRTINELLAEARARLRRLSAVEAFAAAQQGAVLVDTRSEADRREQGVIAYARHYPLSILEWMLDPESGNADPEIGLDALVILVCKEGYSSSLAAARLLDLGFSRATDVIDGVEGWRAAGLPLDPD